MFDFLFLELIKLPLLLKILKLFRKLLLYQIKILKLFFIFFNLFSCKLFLYKLFLIEFNIIFLTSFTFI